MIALLLRMSFQSWRRACLLVVVLVFSATYCSWFYSNGGSSFLFTDAKVGMSRNLQSKLDDVANQVLLGVEQMATEKTKLIEILRQAGFGEALGLSNLKIPDMKFPGLSPQEAWDSGPWSVTGTCDKETTYTITSGEELEKLTNELECIFARGFAPLEPPLGIWTGHVLKVLNTHYFNKLVESSWSGKLGLKTKCQGTDMEYYMILNYALNELKFPAYVYIGKLVDPLRPSENNDQKLSLFVDYTLDMTNVCPSNQFRRHKLNMGVISDTYPFNQIIDLLRVVGRTEDGGYILLGKSLIRDMHRFPDIGDATFAWWYVVSYDADAFGSIPRTLGKLDESFEYHSIGLLDFARRFLSIDDAASDPLGTLLRYVDLVLRKPFGLPPLSDEIKQHNENWPLAGKPIESQEHMILSTTPNDIPGPFTFSGRLPGPLQSEYLRSVEADADTEVSNPLRKPVNTQ